MLLIHTADPAARAGSTRLLRRLGRAEEREPTQERPDTSTRSEGWSGVSSGASGRYLTTGGLGLNSDLEGLRCCRGGAK